MTPNIDRLAAMGTTFERAITQVPVCNRLAGQRLHRAAAEPDRHPRQRLPWYERVDAADTLPAVLRQSGAYVAMYGKNFHADPIDAALQSIMFDEFL